MFNIWKMRYLPYMLVNFVQIKIKHVEIGADTKIYGRIFIKGSGKIKVGERCLLNSSIHADPIGGDSAIILRADNGASLIIGDGCGLSNCAIVAQEEIVIQDNVYIGGGCKIYDTDFHSLDRDERCGENKTYVKKSKVEIKKGAFIGSHSIILKGVSIGENSIIGAGSVVTKNVPDNEVWAGNPARKVRDI